MFIHRYIHSHRRRGEKLQENSMLLTELKEGQVGIILEIVGGPHAAKRLADLGLSPGAEVEVLSSTFFSGPVQILICGSKLVLGRGLATKILVEPK